MSEGGTSGRRPSGAAGRPAAASEPVVVAQDDVGIAPAPASSPAPRLGAPPGAVRDHLYWLGADGFIFTSPWIVSASTERQTAVLLLTASGRPVHVTVAGRCCWERAIAFAPLTRRGLRALDVGLVSVNIQPHHPYFATFSRIARSGGQALVREAFRRFDHDLVRAYEGRLSRRDAERLFEGLVEEAVAQMQVGRLRDERLDHLRALIQANPECSLRDVAQSLGVSYTAASQLFARAVGLRLRTYQHWMRCMRAVQCFRGEVDLRKANLTGIAQTAGFADLAHFSRTWQHRFGVSPSYIRDTERVRIID